MTASALAIPAVAGIASGLIMAGLDELLSRAWRDISDAPSLISGWSPAQLIVGLFYGGVTEEIMMRWGLLSALAALLLRLFGRGGRGRVIALVAAVVLSAALFAASHLPMLYLDGVPPGPLVARTLALNSLLGLFFGAVFVRSGLEAAIVAHGGFHLGVMVAALTAWLLPV